MLEICITFIERAHKSALLVCFPTWDALGEFQGLAFRSLLFKPLFPACLQFIKVYSFFWEYAKAGLVAQRWGIWSTLTSMAFLEFPEVNRIEDQFTQGSLKGLKMQDLYTKDFCY